MFSEFRVRITGIRQFYYKIPVKLQGSSKSVTESREFSVLRPRIPVKLRFLSENVIESREFSSPIINSARISAFPSNFMDTSCGIGVYNHEFRKNLRFSFEFYGHTLRNWCLQP